MVEAGWRGCRAGEGKGEAALEDGLKVVGLNGKAVVGGDGIEEVPCKRLGRADEDSGGATVVEVGAVVSEPKVVVSDCGEVTLGGFIKLRVAVSNGGEGGDGGGFRQVRWVELELLVAEGAVVKRLVIPRGPVRGHLPVLRG